MKKNNITLVFVAIVFSIIVGMIIGKSLLKYKEGEPDVVGSFSMNRDENFTVVANRKNISDLKKMKLKSLNLTNLTSHHARDVVSVNALRDALIRMIRTLQLIKLLLQI